MADDRQPPEPKRPRREGDDADADATGSIGGGIALGPLLYFPQAEEAGSGGAAAAAFPSLRHTDPECHVRLSEFLRGAGLKTALVSGPHRAVSVLLHKPEAAVAGGRDDVWLMLGVHPQQAEFEAAYARAHRHRKAALAFVQDLLRNLHPTARAAVGEYLQGTESALLHPDADNLSQWAGEGACAALVGEVAKSVAEKCPENRLEALEREAWRQRCRHTSLATALLQRFVARTGLALGDVLFRPSPAPGLSRLTLVLWEPSTHQPKPPPALILLPAAHLVLAPPTTTSPTATTAAAGGGGSGVAGEGAGDPVEGLVQRLVATFWGHIWRHGYYPAAALRDPVSAQLAAFFRSGLVQHGKMSLLAGFGPKRHFSLYLQGLAGAGKSSFVAKLVPALAATVEELLDPEMDVRFVKQALNKPLAELDRELTLRPNNNDLSVMSIIQGRRQTLQQAKPGLVVVGLEEVPPAGAGSDGDGDGDATGTVVGVEEEQEMEQRATLTLLADRFSGLRGSGAATSAADRERLLRQNRGGISNHPEVLTVFTSNYPLDPQAQAALAALPMFQHLVQVPVAAIQDEERLAFARGYLAHCLREQLRKLPRPGHGHAGVEIDVEVEVERAYLEGLTDIRDLVRHLRTVAFTAAPRLAPLLLQPDTPTPTIALAHDGAGLHIHLQQQPLLSLRPGQGPANRGLLFPVRAETGSAADNAAVCHPLARRAMGAVAGRMAAGGGRESHIGDEIGHALDYFFNDVLAPAVLLFLRSSGSSDSSSDPSSSSSLAQALFEAVTGGGEWGAEAEAVDTAVSGIGPVDAGSYRIVKSLYDARDERNLRDDIRALRQHAPEARVAVHVKATTEEAQLKIRELLEDTPSMVAFSTARSALQKRGLLFLVEVGDRLTPELKSRASLIIEV